MRGVSKPGASAWVLAALTVVGAGACGDTTAPERDEALPAAAARYLDDPTEGPRALAAAQRNPENGYARERRAHYTAEGWQSLPVWRPKVHPVRVGDTRPTAPALAADADVRAEVLPRTVAAYRTLGETLFFTYPTQLVSGAQAAAANPARFGLGVTDGQVDGLVWVELPSGPALALTCAACHSRPSPFGPIAGLGNPDFDFGRLVGAPWPAGRVDVTTDGRDDPMLVADLRAVRFQRSLNRAATLRNGLVPLAARAETQIIESLGLAVRPPRPYALALAVYLFELGTALPEPGEGAGRAVFERVCARCHAGAALSGEPVPLASVGTDTTLAESPERRTGDWQVPSLRGAGDRGLLFAGGEVDSLRTLLDPSRTVAGHRFGLDLDPADRAALLDFLRAL